MADLIGFTKTYIHSLKGYCTQNPSKIGSALIYDLLSASILVAIAMTFYSSLNIVLGLSILKGINFAAGIVISILLNFSALVVINSFFKYLSYKQLDRNLDNNFGSNLEYHLDNKLDHNLRFSSFLKINIVWWFVWALLYIIMVFGINTEYQGYYLALGVILYSGLSLPLRAYLWQKQNNDQTNVQINVSLVLGVFGSLLTKCGRYVLILATLLILLSLGFFVLRFINPGLYLGWVALVYLVLQGWSRYYLSICAKGEDRRGIEEG